MSKKLLIALIAIVVVLGGGGASAYFYFTNTPKNKYLLSEQKSTKTLTEYFSNRFEESNKFQEALQDNAYDTKVTLGADVSDEVAENFGIPASMLNASKIVFGVKSDQKAQISGISINPTIADSEMGNISWSADKENQYIEAPVLSNPLLFKNDQILSGLGKLMGEENPTELFGEDIKNDTLNLNNLLSNASGNVDADKIANHYLKFVIDAVDKKNFKKGSGQVSILGDKQKLDNVTLALSKKDVKKLILSVVEEVKKDSDIKKIVKNSSPTTNFNKEMDKAIQDLKKSDDYPSFKSVIYIDGKDIKKREITINPPNSGKLVAVIDTNFDKDLALKVVLGDADEAQLYTLEGSSKGEKTVVDKYTFTSNDETFGIKVKFNNKEELKDKTLTNDMNFDISEQGATFINLNYKQDLMTDVKNNEQNSKGILTLDLDGQKIKLLLDTDTKLKADVKTDVKDAKDVNKMSASEIEKLSEEVSEKITNLFMGVVGGI